MEVPIVSQTLNESLTFTFLESGRFPFPIPFGDTEIDRWKFAAGVVFFLVLEIIQVIFLSNKNAKTVTGRLVVVIKRHPCIAREYPMLRVEKRSW